MQYDVIIVGAGPAGLCLSKNLSQLGLSSVLLDRQPEAALAEPAIDGRDIALTHLSHKMLNTLGVWNFIPQEAVSVIRKAQVFDGESAYNMQLGSPDDSYLGMIVPNHLIRLAAYKAIKGDANITLMEYTTLKSMECGSSGVTVTLASGQELTARLLVAADSRFSETRRLAGISADMHDFGKTMIVCQMAHESDHGGVAHECFHYGHTLAVLPLNGKRSSVIITHTPAEAAKLMAMPGAQFSQWVSTQFRYRLGAMQLDSERYAYPLVGAYAERFVATRFALVGDAAVGMHPVTAHGFNFGLKSIHYLCREIRSALDKRQDIASDAVLASYERHHRRATKPLYLTTNGIVSLYTNDTRLARTGRKALLHLANRMAPVKHQLMKKLTATELAPPLPRPITALRKLFKPAA